MYKYGEHKTSGYWKDFKRLKRFPAPKESLDAWERLFLLKGINETPGIKLFPGFGAIKVYKARVIPLREKCGKSDVYRVVFQLLGNSGYKILLFSRHGIYNNEQNLIGLIKERIDYG